MLPVRPSKIAISFSPFYVSISPSCWVKSDNLDNSDSPCALSSFLTISLLLDRCLQERIQLLIERFTCPMNVMIPAAQYKALCFQSLGDDIGHRIHATIPVAAENQLRECGFCQGVKRDGDCPGGASAICASTALRSTGESSTRSGTGCPISRLNSFQNSSG